MKNRDREYEDGHRWRFGERWQRKREGRSTRAMWATVGLDVILLGLIVVMVWVAINSWR